MDRVIIRDLLTRCLIGTTPEERRDKQDVLISVTLSADLRVAGQSDRSEDTVDCQHLRKCILQEVEMSSYALVEALAERVAALCLEWPQVHEARVLVERPNALRFASSVGVEICRRRSEP